MSGLSVRVVCGVVLIFQIISFTPVLPSVAPDVDFELRYGDDSNRNSLLYDIAPSNTLQSRLKRQVTVPPPDQIPDKSVLIKSNVTSSPNAKKPLAGGTKASVQGPTALPPVSVNNIPTSTNANGADSSLPTQQPGNTIVNAETTEASKPVDFPDESVLFEGNSSYPNFPNNKTFYQQNVSQKEVDKFKYYIVNYDPEGVSKYWIEMENNPKAKNHGMLSNAHRRAATMKPEFPILFYGHQIPNLTVATGGFIYLGDQVHAWLAATQYVAPLMANFDSSTTPNATVNYVSTSDFFTVEWNQVRLQDSPKDGPFTFQTTLYRNGTIVFVYKTIPISVGAINDTHHPVKVGLSDAYIKDKNMLFVRQKTIYEYDRVDLKSHPNVNITNGTAIIFTPYTTCQQLQSCQDCTTAQLKFKCFWCPSVNRCSNGTDRYTQDWTLKGCDKPNGNFTESQQCSQRIDPSSTYNVNHDHDHEDHDHVSDFTGGPYIKKIKAPEQEGMSAAGVIGVMFLMILLFGSVGWLAYAYFFPHSPSGQMLIRYRPSQWAFRRGEARYTAASIHM